MVYWRKLVVSTCWLYFQAKAFKHPNSSTLKCVFMQQVSRTTVFGCKTFQNLLRIFASATLSTPMGGHQTWSSIALFEFSSIVY
jgi:hypothetical protein